MAAELGNVGVVSLSVPLSSIPKGVQRVHLDNLLLSLLQLLGREGG